jgi:hypothetical protein
MAKLQAADVSQDQMTQWVNAFGQADGVAWMLQLSIDDPATMRNIVQNGVLELQRRIVRAVEAGVRALGDGVYEFTDCGLAFSTLERLNVTKEIVRRSRSSSFDAWMTASCMEPQKRRVRIIAERAICKTLRQQGGLLRSGEIVCEPRVAFAFFVTCMMARVDLHLPATFLARTAETSPSGQRYVIGIDDGCVTTSDVLFDESCYDHVGLIVDQRLAVRP